MEICEYSNVCTIISCIWSIHRIEEKFRPSGNFDSELARFRFQKLLLQCNESTRLCIWQCMYGNAYGRYGMEDTPKGTYTGMFFEGRRHGYGTEERGGFCYRGYWDHGVRHGWGEWVVRVVAYEDKKSVMRGKHRVGEVKVRPPSHAAVRVWGHDFLHMTRELVDKTRTWNVLE